MARELDDALLDLRFNQPEIGAHRAQDRGRCSRGARSSRREALLELAETDWFADEVCCCS
jgi:hypothetical protein